VVVHVEQGPSSGSGGTDFSRGGKAGTNRALNVMRAGAAIVVCVGHVRGYLLKPLAGHNYGPATSVMYALTSLGHGAVMVFFVLSGYFVGGSVIRGRARAAFRWSTYLTARTLRLWLVLVPALVLTAILDRVGRHAYPHTLLYNDTARAVTHSGLGDFLGNVFFLQSQIVPVYGSNGPVWSLGYEFAYYVLFPLILVGVLGAASSRRWRLAAGALAIGVAAAAGPLVIALFITWLAGAWIAWKEVEIRALVGRMGRSRNLARLVTLGALVGAMAVDNVLNGSVNSINVGTYATAVSATVLVILFVPDVRPRPRWADSALHASRHLAESSYSLYAYHVPVVALVATALTPNGPTYSHDPNLAGWALVVGLTLSLIAGGWVFARGTEHYYKPLRARALRRIERRDGTRPEPAQA
jgi:peptidoglycan/LPS O-acetylase OafA/YrhL